MIEMPIVASSQTSVKSVRLLMGHWSSHGLKVRGKSEFQNIDFKMRITWVRFWLSRHFWISDLHPLFHKQLITYTIIFMAQGLGSLSLGELSLQT